MPSLVGHRPVSCVLESSAPFRISSIVCTLKCTAVYNSLQNQLLGSVIDVTLLNQSESRLELDFCAFYLPLMKGWDY